MKRPFTLSARWTRAREHCYTQTPFGKPGDILYEWGDGIQRCDGHLLHSILAAPKIELCFGKEKENHGLPWKFGKSALEELHARGYDVTTLKFSIKKRSGDRPPEPEQGT